MVEGDGMGASEMDRDEHAEPGDPDPVQRDRSIASWIGELLPGVAGEIADRMLRFASTATGASIDMGRALFGNPQDPNLAAEAGSYLREMRELAGLTVDELSDAISLEDRSLLQAVEEGTAALSFELVLRLSAILARHDPLPFLIRFTRTYNPEVWRVLEDFGVGRLPLHFERERRFINIYRRHDGARKLSDEGFAHVLDVTRAAFELALHFATAEEHVADHLVDPDRDPAAVDPRRDEAGS
jgi:transcriptional regulator with XRE-family HTH domain